MVLVIFMIQFCTIATLMFVQNNTSQKLLIIASRTINSLGLCSKYVSIKLFAIVTSNYIFRCQKYPYLSKIYISAISKTDSHYTESKYQVQILFWLV